MKKVYMFLVVLALMFVSEAKAQINFGIKGGLNVTDMSLSNDVLKSSNRTGFYIGPTVKFTLPVVGLGIDASALYDHRSAKVEAPEGGSETFKQQQIAIPINLRYGFGLGDLASLFIFAGPQFGFNVGGDIDEINWEWKKSNFSVNVGLGLMLVNHLQVNANYNIACGKTGEIKVPDAVEEAFDGKFNSWQIGLAYYF